MIGKLLRQVLDKLMVSPVAQEARVQVALPDGKYYDVQGIQLLENKILGARDVREDDSAGEFDIVKILKAPKNLKRRKYWEAYLVIKLKPAMQLSAHCRNTYSNRVEIANGRDKKKRYPYRSMRTKTGEEQKKDYLLTAYDHLKKFKYFMSRAKA